jgi:pyridoxamine 5'-phosphate oxidase
MTRSADAEIRDHWPDDPWTLLADWLPANDDPVRPVMTLATVSDEGIPDARTLLLSEWDEQGLYFHTDSRSRKVRQLAASPAVALMVHLPDAARQLTVQGVAEPASSDELSRAFRARSAYLQQLAWQNTVEFAGLPLADRLRAWAVFRDDHADGFGQPPTWTGYLVRPSRLTFWIGSADTASRRTEYTRTPDGGWTVSLLAG